MAAGAGPTVRRLHQWAGALFCPAIIYFGLTGLVQVYNLHKARDGLQPPAVVLALAQLHKSQTVQVARQGPKPHADEGAMATRPGKPEPSDKPKAPPSAAQWALKAWAAAAAIAQVALGATGLWMALQPRRGRRTVTVLACAGVLVPLALALSTT